MFNQVPATKKLAGCIPNNARIFSFDYLSLCCCVYN